MKAMSIETVYLNRGTLQPGTSVEIRKFPFYSFVFVGDRYCGKILNSAIKNRFIHL